MAAERKMKREERRMKKQELQKIYKEFKQEEGKEYLTEKVVNRLDKERTRERMEPVRMMPMTVFQDPPAGNLELMIEITDQEHRDLLWSLGLLF